MSKPTNRVSDDDLRPEYDLTQLRGGVRGKYYRRAMSDTNLILIEPDLLKTFPDAASVNRALRLLADAARQSASASTRLKGSAPRPNRRRAASRTG
jgi:hypothetical protein